MSLYHNLGNGKFEDVTKKAGLDPTLHGISCTVGDYDNDGFADLAVTVNDRSHALPQRKERNIQRCRAADAAGINQLRGFNSFAPMNGSLEYDQMAI